MTNLIKEIKQEVEAMLEVRGHNKAVLEVDIQAKLDQLLEGVSTYEQRLTDLANQLNGGEA